jgi:hypothetical protein
MAPKPAPAGALPSEALPRKAWKRNGVLIPGAQAELVEPENIAPPAPAPRVLKQLQG